MKISLTGGDAQARSVVASAQRTLNLYAEPTDPKEGEPTQVTHYPTPGLRVLTQSLNGKPFRGLYRASNGDLYAVAGFDVYFIDPQWVSHLIGTMNTTSVLNPVKFADNGVTLILCDGTPTNGYAIVMSTHNGLAPLLNPAVTDVTTPKGSTGWLGSTFVDFYDTYFIANFIGTPTFYISNSLDVVFDPLQFAGKQAYADALVGAIVQHRVLWLIGVLTTEVWYHSGGTSVTNNFPFEIMPGVAIDWGCVAPYSIVKAETAIFWLAQNLNGEVVVLRGAGYTVQRISTHAMEYQFSLLADVTDCIGYSYMQDGHSFYVMNFPSADKTWVFDLAVQQWHERCWLDPNGAEHMQRTTMHAFAYQTNVVNDWQNANLYALDPNVHTDNGSPIKRLISFPRQIDSEDGNRVVFRSFQADMDCGESTRPNDTPTLTLDWSDDKGRVWSNGLTQGFGRMGQYLTTVNFNRLGMSRNRVFRLAWAADAKVALTGAFVHVTKAGS